ncbi:hypothetical protein Niako_4744 [Niastella koreensis GR20-10]|uniref:Uncharacterized protein n=1 Tax=Niastella koreensis (strain DSM 17620 / KACC 11465 / NBRC 106392 / GR20-10) TaxID=700598 RepID=G8TNS4_NIAKG|nr:hypothetical protein Niako_4744 [Niastella koreensis GR20-10]
MVCNIEYAFMNLSLANIFSRFHNQKKARLFILPRAPQGNGGLSSNYFPFRLSALSGWPGFLFPLLNQLFTRQDPFTVNRAIVHEQYYAIIHILIT